MEIFLKHMLGGRSSKRDKVGGERRQSLWSPIGDTETLANHLKAVQ